MLVTFSTDAHADITMFGNVALCMLELMGHSKTVTGALLAADVPMALNRLKTGVSLKRGSPTDENEEDEPNVSLHDRALPLIDLLTAAAAGECNVMWK